MALNKTIGFRLLRIVFGCYFAVAVAVTSVQLVSEYMKVKENIFGELRHLSNTLEDSLSRALWNYNDEQVQATLLGISKIEMVAGTRVANIDQKVIATSGIDFDSNIDLSASKEEGAFGKGKIYKFNYPSENDGETIFEYKFPVHYVDPNGNVDELVGYSYIYTKHSIIIDRVKYGFILIIINSLIKTLALWFIFLFFTKRIVAKPLSSLTEAARSFDPSNLDSFRDDANLAMLSASRHDNELKVLADSFIKMQNSIVEKIDVIEAQNSTLEKRVDERTANLTEANKSLEQEVEQRRLAEESLRIYQEIILNTNEAIMVTTPDGTIIEVNPAYEHNFGYSRDELIDSSPGILRSVQENAAISEEMWTGIKNNGHWRGEVTDIKKDGEEIPLWIAVSVICDAAGEVQYLVSLYHNLTELKQAESRLAQAQKLESIGQLAAGVAHEINTPTQFVGDNIRFLKDAFHDYTEVHNAYNQLLQAAKNQSVTAQEIELVENALREADSEYLAGEVPVAIAQSIDGVQRIAKIVGAMKAFSHMGSESKEHADLNMAITNTMTVASNEWKYYADIEMDLEENLPAVPCFPAEFNQVVLNLVVNAAHAIKDVIDNNAGEKGLIKVSSRHLDNCVEVRISDNGSGIPESAREKIFDPFFTTKEVGKGTGQGLSIAHSTIVEKHGGTLSFETENGAGTTFVITIPLGEPGDELSTAATA